MNNTDVKQNVIRIVNGLSALKPKVLISLEQNEFVATVPMGLTVPEAEAILNDRLTLVPNSPNIMKGSAVPDPTGDGTDLNPTKIDKRFIKFKMCGSNCIVPQKNYRPFWNIIAEIVRH